ncbi:MAG: PP2C family protein-serine/threonine phosphatase [Caldilineaceae bacterium]|nr:PP2C family protein-serine/threonine phosphatase [Caldilineaceae bacterium]MCY3993979.1 PP2C family protein-serine/threonine phosphatase [Caldilineaceae bacterium]MDE0079540.1 PP2C family protein-serine/threonine phosphatase [Caldilineaceae bacterium]
MNQIEIQIAVAKVSKYASSESGDTVEVVERPHGGISIVVSDGQRSGRSAKAISNVVARKAMSLIAEGVRDGAVARATHDYLRTNRGGKVSAELVIASVDLVTETLVLSRNSRCPVLVQRNGEAEWLDEECDAIGIYRNTKPNIVELPLAPGLTAVVFTDGIWSAGHRSGGAMDVAGAACLNESRLVSSDAPEGGSSAKAVADRVLEAALELDNGRPRDDSTVLVIKVGTHQWEQKVRRMEISLPI